MAEHDHKLAALDRDLRFFSADEEAARALTREQVRSFNETGYLKPFRVFDDAAVEENRRYFDALLERALATGRNSYSINGFQRTCRGIYDLVKHPAILALVRDILGEDVVCWGTHYFCKLPGDGKAVAWHQDASYWPLTPSKTVTAWLAIDDADRANGCMKVVPGTHRLGPLKFRDSKPDENNVLWQTIDDPERYGTPEYFELRAGEISLHADLLVHGSEPNTSDRRRCGLTMRYASTDVVAHWGWNAGSVLCLGRDPEGHWADIPRPAADELPV